MYKEKEIIFLVNKLPVNRVIRTDIYIFIKNYKFSDKKIDFLLSLKTPNEQLGFLYRNILTAAYQFGVPSVYIYEYQRYKRYFIRYKDTRYNINKLQELKNTMNLKSKMILDATNELMKNKNNRQEKINEILIKMSNKKNNI